jgi:hypothetical protein
MTLMPKYPPHGRNVAATVLALAIASVFFGGSPACEKCEDRPGMGGYSITPETFRVGSVAAGNAATYAEWLDEMSKLSCEAACDRLVGVEPITLTSCSSSKSVDASKSDDAAPPDAGSGSLWFRCEWVHHSCDKNPGCGG